MSQEKLWTESIVPLWITYGNRKGTFPWEDSDVAFPLYEYVKWVRDEFWVRTSDKLKRPLFVPHLDLDYNMTGIFPVDVDLCTIHRKPRLNEINRGVFVAYSTGGNGHHIFLYEPDVIGTHHSKYEEYYYYAIKESGLLEFYPQGTSLWDMKHVSQGLFVTADNDAEMTHV